MTPRRRCVRLVGAVDDPTAPIGACGLEATVPLRFGATDVRWFCPTCVLEWATSDEPPLNVAVPLHALTEVVDVARAAELRVVLDAAFPTDDDVDAHYYALETLLDAVTTRLDALDRRPDRR